MVQSSSNTPFIGRSKERRPALWLVTGFSALLVFLVYHATPASKSSLEEYIPPGELVPYKQSAFRSISRQLKPTMKQPLDTLINDAWRQDADNVGQFGDGRRYGKLFGNHGLYGKNDEADGKNLKNGWQLESFRRELAALGIPRNITDNLQRLGILSVEDLDTVDTYLAVNNSAPAWEGELPAFALGAGGAPAVIDNLPDSSLPQPKVRPRSLLEWRLRLQRPSLIFRRQSA